MSEYIYESQGEPLANERGEVSLARKEVVRCRVCKHFTPQGAIRFLNNSTNAAFCSYIRAYKLQIGPDGFCAWGERK